MISITELKWSSKSITLMLLRPLASALTHPKFTLFSPSSRLTFTGEIQVLVWEQYYNINFKKKEKAQNKTKGSIA